MTVWKMGGREWGGAGNIYIFSLLFGMLHLYCHCTAIVAISWKSLVGGWLAWNGEGKHRRDFVAELREAGASEFLMS
jgi:hypothetical protein